MENTKYTEEFKQSIVNLYESGKSSTQICKEYGISSSTLHKQIKKYKKFIQTANNHENNDEKGVDIYTIQKVMGHSDISVTAGTYVHNDIEVLRKQLKIDH